MKKKRYRFIYGPVSSWRLGRSLGIDPVSPKKSKICTFNCVYCQIGRQGIFESRRKVFVPTGKILKEIKSLPSVKIDYITFSGAGDPTLAENLGDIIKEIKKIRKDKIAVLTNSSSLNRKDVRKDLMKADLVVAKLDAHSQKLFEKINKPKGKVKFDGIVKGLLHFRKTFKGKFALQIMFIKENKPYAKEIASLARKIHPDEIQINTPLRPCGRKALSKKELDEVKKYFKAARVISVYEAKKKKIRPLNKKSTLKRRGKI